MYVHCTYNVHTMNKIRRNYRFKVGTINDIETICKSTDLNETEAVEKAVKEYCNLLKQNVHTIVHTDVHTPPKEAVISTPITPVHAHTHEDRNNFSLRGSKGELSFYIDENGKEIPVPVSSPELDAKQKEIEAKWKAEYEESLRQRGLLK